MNKDEQDLVVIGAGTSGMMVAFGALRLGLKVTLIEKSNRLGGSSLHMGCIPSKALIHVANVAHSIRTADAFGLNSPPLPVDFGKINDHIADVIQKVQIQDESEKFRQLGGRLLVGMPRFVDKYTLQLDKTRIVSKKFVIATGSEPSIPNLPGLSEVGYITNETIFQQYKLPERLIIIGGKPSAIEFAQAMTRLGTKVIVIESGEQVLSSEDPELVWQLRSVLEAEGVTFCTHTQVQEIYSQNKRKVALCMDQDGEQFTVHGDEILMATGRKPSIAQLGLEYAGVEYYSDGIAVDKRLRSSQKHIYALGDVIRSPYKLTHAAEYQANVVLSNLVFRFPSRVNYKGFPYVIFTDPEYAHVGLTEKQVAGSKFYSVDILRFDFKDIDSAILKGVQYGRIKVLTRKRKIVGATILGPQAGNLIAEFALAIQTGATLDDISATVHAYPTLSQINRRVISRHLSQSMFSGRSQRFVSWMQRVFA